METALTDPRKTEINADFHVSTALFSSHFETRLFSKIDEVPEELVKLITDAVDSLSLLDGRFLTTDTNTRYAETSEDEEDYACACGCDAGDYDSYEDEGETYVTGLAVESYAFKDANALHDVVTSTVRDYVSTRKRTVSYV